MNGKRAESCHLVADERHRRFRYAHRLEDFYRIEHGRVVLQVVPFDEQIGCNFQKRVKRKTKVEKNYLPTVKYFETVLSHFYSIAPLRPGQDFSTDV